MIVKMIQNLENKMELQINSLETRTEKMQEMFNKDLEEIKKSQYIINNAINDIKNTLEGTNSRITEEPGTPVHRAGRDASASSRVQPVR